jgi:hypothetical protein
LCRLITSSSNRRLQTGGPYVFSNFASMIILSKATKMSATYRGTRVNSTPRRHTERRFFG